MRVILSLCLFLTAGLVSYADRTLDRSEVEALLQTLTASPKSVWLPAGTIRTRYLEYHNSEPFVHESEELYRLNGQQFYWDIQLADLPADTIIPGITEKTDYLANQHRIFACDGQTYTRYYESSGHATVILGQWEASSSLHGPFSAGILPWGLGSFTLDKLSAYPMTVTEFTEDGSPRIQLVFKLSQEEFGFEAVCVLVPDKGYAPVSYILQNKASIIRHTYRDLRQVGSSWIPFMINIERIAQRDTDEPKLIMYQDWQFISVDPAVPTESFKVTFANDTTVELHASDQMQSFMYHASQNVNINELLQEKIVSLSTTTQDKPNCAAAVAGHIARRFSKTLPQNAFDAAAAAPENLVSLYNIRLSLEQIGLYCAAVKTDVQSIASFQNYGVILHYPVAKHYVILDRIDGDTASIIDLTDRKFYWKHSIDELMHYWKDGIALLVSDTPILASGQLQFLDNAAQQQIMGGFQPLYTCTKVIQDTEKVLCSEPLGGLCGGAYYRIWMRYGCEQSPFGEGCFSDTLSGYDYSLCVTDPFNTNSCEITSVWHTRNIRACR